MFLENYLEEEFGLNKDQQTSLINFAADLKNIELSAADDVEEMDLDELEEIICEFKESTPEGMEVDFYSW